MKPFSKSKSINTLGDGTKVKTCGIRVPQSLHDRIIRQANKEHRSFASQIIHYVEVCLKVEEEGKNDRP